VSINLSLKIAGETVQFKKAIAVGAEQMAYKRKTGCDSRFMREKNFLI
jgi:hypothetical protein